MIRAAPPALDDAALQRLLDEDVRFGDLTTETLGIDAGSGVIRFIARDPMRLCGSDEAARLMTLAGAAVTRFTASGTEAPPGTLLLEARGEVGALHRGWKSAQTLME